MHAASQFVRYAIVGIGSNLVLYILYLVATWFGAQPKVAMTALYALGVLQTFAFNRTWSFKHAGPTSWALLRYVLVYLLGYGINLVALTVFVDRYGYSHRIVQGVMILVVAVFLFVAQRHWVFSGVTGRGAA